MGSISIPVYIAASEAVAAIGSAAPIVSAVAGIGGTVLGAVGSREAGIAKADDLKRQANQAALDSKQKQIDIRQKMLGALASQNAAAGVGGIGTGGSFGANVQRQITQNQNDLETLAAGSSAQQQGYAFGEASASATGSVAAGQSLLDKGLPAVSNLAAQLS